MRLSRTRVAVVLALGLAFAAAARSAPETFVFDKAHTLVGFRIRHWLTKVDGRFRDFDGRIWLDRANPSGSKVEVTIQTASIDTSNINRDKHLRSADFFDAEKYPVTTFKSTKVTPRGTDLYDVTGDLTLHGVTKTMTIPVRHTGFLNLGKEEKAGFELTIPINRKDFGIVWNRTSDSGGVMLGDDVDINVQVEANKEMPTDPAAPAAPPAPAPTPRKAPAR
jgi:polyisoprenoid-binding protein YceI